MTQSPEDHTTPQTQPVQRTRLNKPWLIRIFGLLIGVTALAGWFALDAWVIYPKRGEKAIKFNEVKYLQQAVLANLASNQIDIIDPDAERRALSEKRSPQGPSLTPVETERLDWLTQLSRLHNLEAIAARNQEARRIWAGEPGDIPDGPITVFRDPRARLAELNTEIAESKAPKPLSTFDMPSQYAGLIVCLAGSVFLLIFFFRIRAQVYTYEAATMKLTLPSGFSFTPDRIETVDKRKWDKFIVFLTLQGETEERKIDLFRHNPLEDWILEMEKHHPNYDPDADEDEEESDEPEEEADESDDASDNDAPSLRTE